VAEAMRGGGVEPRSVQGPSTSELPRHMSSVARAAAVVRWGGGIRQRKLWEKHQDKGKGSREAG